MSSGVRPHSSSQTQSTVVRVCYGPTVLPLHREHRQHGVGRLEYSGCDAVGTARW